MGAILWGPPLVSLTSACLRGSELEPVLSLDPNKMLALQSYWLNRITAHAWRALHSPPTPTLTHSQDPIISHWTLKCPENWTNSNRPRGSHLSVYWVWAQSALGKSRKTGQTPDIHPSSDSDLLPQRGRQARAQMIRKLSITGVWIRGMDGAKHV